METDVVIAGAGLSGLVSSILLARSGQRVILIEKNHFPFHRVCGEYISNEVVPFLEKNDLFPSHLKPSKITKLHVSATNGRSFEMPLDLGGFGVSRYEYDAWLANKATDSGVTLKEGLSVDRVSYTGTKFITTTSDGQEYASAYFIGAHGKRSMLDKNLGRDFLIKKSPYVGVKYHVMVNLPEDTVYLHNFEGGYCGVCKIEGDHYNLCYLIHRETLRKAGSIAQCEKDILSKNPHLDHIFRNATFLNDVPKVINEVSFEAKEPALGPIPMIGDAAGTITPLCGNGMANAIRAASILSSMVIEQHASKSYDPSLLASKFGSSWKKTFATRLWTGRQIQQLFGTGSASNMGVFFGQNFKPLTRFLMSKTHGEPFT